MPDKRIPSKPFFDIISAIVLCLSMDIVMFALQKAITFAYGRIAGNLLFFFLVWHIFFRNSGETIRQLFSPLKKHTILNFGSGYILGIACLLGFFSLRLSGREFLLLSKSKLSLFGLFLFPMVGFFRPNGIAVLTVACMEEILFRGIILKNALKLFANKYIASIAVVVIFMAFHAVNYLSNNLMLFDVVFVVSITFIYQFVLTIYTVRVRDIAFIIAWHYTYDVTLYRLIGFPTA